MNTSEKKWTLPGMCFNTKNPNKPIEATISFPCGQNVVVGGSKTHSGQAVDADVAALFINNFYSYYKLTVNEEPDKVEEPHPTDFELLKTKHTALKAHHNKVKRMNESLVNMTYGMTLDKDMLLNVLGQQGCEGLRFYLCARQIEDQKMHLSLVAVGVDKTGFDLNYNKPQDGPIIALMAGLNSIPTQSVTLEYTTPPPPNNTGLGDRATAPENIADEYALLKLARGNQPEGFEQAIGSITLI